MSDGVIVTECIAGAHPSYDDYPLLPGDLLTQDADGTWTKEAPGLCLGGFVLTDQKVATSTRPVEFERQGLDYLVAGGVPELKWPVR